MRSILSSFLLLSLLLCNGCANEAADATTTQQAADTTQSTTAKTEKENLLFFGNSLTAGYGLETSQAFPALIQQKIDSAGLAYRVINGGVSGETSAAGNQRIDFVLKQQAVSVFVLELGANDGLRGIQPVETKKNLQSIIDKVKAKYPNVKLVMAGMQMPPNMGPSYTKEFSELYPELAKKNNMALIPFLLQGVADVPRLNLEDG
ncbi:MAG: arylesterase, partial [Chitinophagaceae bacterium]